MLDKQIDIVAMKVHDCFNIIAISFICATNSLFLYHATDFSKVGTEYLGQGHELVFNRLLVAFSIYLVIDAVWVLCVPNCIPSDPFGNCSSLGDILDCPHSCKFDTVLLAYGDRFAGRIQHTVLDVEAKYQQR